MRRLLSLTLLAISTVSVHAEVVTDAFLLPVPRNARTPTPIDPVALAFALGESLIPGGAGWTKISANEDGWFEDARLASSFAGVTVRSAAERIVLLRASGHGMAYVNGVPRAGDVYAYGYTALPVRLRAGENHLLFAPGRGRLRIEWREPARPVALEGADALLPDLSPHVSGQLPAAINVVNATGNDLGSLELAVRQTNRPTRRFAAQTVAKESTRKLRFAVDASGGEEIEVVLLAGGKKLDSIQVKLRRREADQAFKRTFVSEIDGSAQYYGVLPPTLRTPNQALFLSLHGAGVEAIGQAEAYAPKSWGWLIAPTNRRPFGFNWEDVGRLDALEVLADAQRTFGTDPSRTYLTGHSMGGHGTWHLGALFPDRWGAIAPSAGWISYWSYAGGATYAEDDSVGAIFRRAAGASDTLAHRTNLAQLPTYILHGDADDNVPVTEARAMREALAPLNPDLRWHEQPGAGHWWDDASPEPGAACVDWPGIFDLFAARRVPRVRERRNIDFVTSSPGVSATFAWATIVQQLAYGRPARIQLRADPHARRISGRTENVRLLQIDTTALEPGGPVSLELDAGPELKLPFAERLFVVLHGKTWRPSIGPNLASEKSPARSGGFKDVFRNRVAFIYGTQGTPAENAWAFAAARYHAETFAYIGNGSIDVLPDTTRVSLAGRNLVLYGNTNTHALWRDLIGDSPVEVAPGRIQAGSNQWIGDDLACLVIRPRLDDLATSVAAISGTGVAGMRAASRAPLFTAGAAIPDLMVFRVDALERGTAGVRMAAFFGFDWGFAMGAHVAREP